MGELSDRVVEFLSAGTRTGMLGYVAGDGRPLVAPVWFVVDGDKLVFNTGRDTSKGRALHRDPRVVICVDDPRPPYSFVQVQGVATVSEDPADVLYVATRTGARYMGTRPRRRVRPPQLRARRTGGAGAPDQGHCRFQHQRLTPALKNAKVPR